MERKDKQPASCRNKSELNNLIMDVCKRIKPKIGTVLLVLVSISAILLVLYYQPKLQMATTILFAIISFIMFIKLICYNHIEDTNCDTVEKLSNMINKLNKDLDKANKELARANEDLYKANKEKNNSLNLTDKMDNNYTLETRYSRVLLSFQRLDIRLKYLEPQVEAYINSLINDALSPYGYKFVDFCKETKDFYDTEIQPTANDEVVYRAIIKADGSLAQKGKVYIKG